jgi:hypothetical protein
MQHFLKRPPASARARIVAAELLDELLVAVNDADTAFHAGFGRETLSDACSSARKQFSSPKSFIWCMVNLLPATPARRRIAVKWKMKRAARMDGRQAGSKRLQRLGQTIQGRNDASCSCVAAISITCPFSFSTTLRMLREADVRVKHFAGRTQEARLQAASR